MGAKRLTFQTQDGKKHWVALRRYYVPEGVVFVPAENPCESRTDHIPLPLAKSGQSDAAPALARDQVATSAGNSGTCQRNTIPPAR